MGGGVGGVAVAVEVTGWLPLRICQLTNVILHITSDNMKTINYIIQDEEKCAFGASRHVRGWTLLCVWTETKVAAATYKMFDGKIKTACVHVRCKILSVRVTKSN